MKSVFTYRSYKKYLKDRFKASAIKGVQSKAAAAAGCQPAYLSQCLNSQPNLTEDQGFHITNYLGLNSQESEFFLELLRLEKAATHSYRKHLKTKLSLLANQNLSVEQTVDNASKMSLEDQSVYYSKWIYSAVHMLLGIPKYRSEKALANHLGYSPTDIKKVLSKLTDMGLVKKSKGVILPGERAIHIGKDSPLLELHHKNLRLKALNEIENLQDDSFVYSSTITISEEVFAEIKEVLVKSMKSIRKKIESSEEEELYCFNLDLFRACNGNNSLY